jgi:ATP-dependent helicase/DNAse subunit B
MSQVNTQTEANDKTLLTYSALNTFRNCPRKYKNRYLDNLRPRERAEALSFGSVIHTAIELWYRSPDTESRLPDAAIAEESWGPRSKQRLASRCTTRTMAKAL